MSERDADISCEMPDVRSSLKAIAQQRTTWATVSMYPPLTAYALKTLKGQNHNLFRCNPGTRWLLQDMEANLDLIAAMKPCKQRLPILCGGAFAGQPRIYALMASCAAEKDGKVTQQGIERTLNDFQAYAELTLCETEQALVCMQWVLLDLVGMHALAQTERMQACENAQRNAKKLKKQGGQDIRFAVIAGGIVYAAQLQRSLMRTAPERFMQYCVDSAGALHLDAQRINRADRLEVLTRQREIKNILKSLQTLRDEADESRCLQTHPAMARLSRQIAYTKLDDQGKEHLIHAVKHIAHRTKSTEDKVVQNAIRLCEEQQDETCLLRYLWEDNPQLYKALGSRFFDRRKLMRRLCFALLWIAVPLLTFLYLFVAITSRAAMLEIIGGALFGFIVIYSCIKDLLMRLSAWLVPKRTLPRLSKMPGDAKCVVVMAVIAETKEQIDDHFRQLQIQAQAFREAKQFALLCDFPQSGQKVDELSSTLTQYGEALAARLNHVQSNRFLLVTRPRTYIQKEGKWMGQDRKRGALMAFNAALLGKRDDVAVYGGYLLQDYRYVLTLNEDTFFPPGEAQRIVCTLAHPYNAKYAVMQPTMATHASMLANSALARLYADPGMRLGHQPISDHEMDVYGFGIFLGQGVYDVRRFYQAANILPYEKFLTHHFVEGALALCALCSDAQALHGFPTRHSSYIKWEHRRIRGLWQQLPLLFGMRGRQRERIKLSAHHRLWLLEQLMRTLVTLCTTQLLAIATFSVLPFGFYVALALIPYLNPLLSFLTAVYAFLWKRTQQPACSFSIRGLLRKVVTDFILCPFDASVSLDALVRALYRMFISRRKLLEWITKEQTERGDARSLLGYHLHMVPALLFNLLMVLFIYINKPQHAFGIVLIAFLWFLSPLAAQRLDHRKNQQSPLFPAYWKKTCKQTYDYFVAITQNNPLPPRTVRIDRRCNSDQTTTPSDIAAALLAHVCACVLRFIGKDEAQARIAGLLCAMEALPKRNGHTGSTICLQNPEVPPGFISCVESANLCLALMITQQALESFDQFETATKAERLWQAMDFKPLFCDRAKLFANGLDIATEKLTKECQNVYASQERVVSYLAVGLNQASTVHLNGFRIASPKKVLFRQDSSPNASMREYLWPTLFFPLLPFTWEGALMRSAAAAQKRASRRRKRRRLPESTQTIVLKQRSEAACASTEVEELFHNDSAQESAGIAPFATALLAPLDEISAYDILRILEREGMRSTLGFYDTQLLSKDGLSTSLHTMVTLHQGMILCALTNLLLDDKLAKWAAKSIPLAATLPFYECSR